jgi:hypothetical protein
MLVIHPRVIDQIAGTWSRVGLDRFCPIVGQFVDQRAVTLKELDVPDLRRLLVGYLDYYREEEDSKRGSIEPFAEDAFSALVDHSQGIAGYFLAYAHFILSSAMKQERTIVNKEVVNAVANERTLEDLDREVSVSLPASDVDLTTEESENS